MIALKLIREKSSQFEGEILLAYRMLDKKLAEIHDCQKIGMLVSRRAQYWNAQYCLVAVINGFTSFNISFDEKSGIEDTKQHHGTSSCRIHPLI